MSLGAIVTQIFRRCSMKRLEYKQTKLELDAERDRQPMQDIA